MRHRGTSNEKKRQEGDKDTFHAEVYGDTSYGKVNIKNAPHSSLST